MATGSSVLMSSVCCSVTSGSSAAIGSSMATGSSVLISSVCGSLSSGSSVGISVTFKERAGIPSNSILRSGMSNASNVNLPFESSEKVPKSSKETLLLCARAFFSSSTHWVISRLASVSRHCFSRQMKLVNPRLSSPVFVSKVTTFRGGSNFSPSIRADS